MVTPGRRIKIGLAITVRTPVLIVGPNKDQIQLIVSDGKILRVSQVSNSKPYQNEAISPGHYIKGSIRS